MIKTPSGLVLLNKPAGITSFRLLGTIKHTLNSGKVGHTGTLDKFAEGLMLVLTGKMTRLASFFSNLNKEYTAVFKFGEETSTLDPEGNIIATADLPSLKLIESVIGNFTGSILQKPPDFSAIHINGKRAYKIAVSGEKPDIPEREIKINEFTILDWRAPFLRVKVKCSKGTYIRSLARDLGLACQSRAYVNFLSRTKVGLWNLHDAIDPEKFDPNLHTISGKNLFERISGIHMVSVSKSISEKILNGIPINKWYNNDFSFLTGTTAVFDLNDEFLALVENNQEKLSYRFVTAGLK